MEMSVVFITFGLVLLSVSVGWWLTSRPKPHKIEQTPVAPDVAAINKGLCPDCGAAGSLLAGPSGGMSQNIGCESCLMEFNVGFGFGTGAFMVDRTGEMSLDRAKVFGITREEYDRRVQQALPVKGR